MKFIILSVLALFFLAAFVPAIQGRKSGLTLKKIASRLRARAHLRMRQEPVEPLPKELPDVRHNHHHMLDEFLDAYKNHHLSFGEIKLLFQTADRNHDNKVSFQEWADFFALFVEPF
jgi:hypothetical protein